MKRAGLGWAQQDTGWERRRIAARAEHLTLEDVQEHMDVALLKQQIEALKQLIEVNEQSVIEQTERAEAAHRQLEQSNVILRSVLASMSDGIVVADRNGKFLFFNKAAEKMLGVGQLDVQPEQWTAQYGIYLPDQTTPYEPADLPLARAIRGEPVDEEELFIRNPHRPSGLWLSVNARPVKNDQGELIGGVAAFRDVTQHKRTTEALKKRNEDLARSNRELDDFAYIASHDLKEPLRGISNYAAFLAEDYADSIDDDGREMMLTLTKLAQRLETLIDSLRHYSRMGRSRISRKKTDLTEVVDKAVAAVQTSLEDHQFDVRIPQPLPTVRGDAASLREAFRHLIQNAVIYNNSDDKWVEIGFSAAEHAAPDGSRGRRRPGQVFYVRDNGIGMRERHLGTIFRIFRRLHARDRYGGGPGAGLTFVKKIVERHGGKIWVESNVGEGSTFYFTLE